jgi:nucleotide-binding universal stress UspA family protein
MPTRLQRGILKADAPTPVAERSAMSTLANLLPSTRRAATVFSHVLVGVDGSPESLDAARQAAVLEAPGGGRLTFLAAWNLAPPLVMPMATLPAGDADRGLARAAAEKAVRGVQQRFPSARPLVVHGPPAQTLIAEIQRAGVTLVAVGTHVRRRAEGVLFGSTATQVIHDAPCSVLVARNTRNAVPRRILVGVDGSPQAEAAYAVGRYLADRFDSELDVVVAEGDKPIDLPAVSLIAGDRFRVIPEDPVRALVAASADTDLLVLGSRGLHGLRALGSVSERVAHQATCSTLIVREG